MKKRILLRDNEPYLIRWTLIKNRFFSIKIHKALVSDPAAPHDHPWNYLSIILWGGYFEEQTERKTIYRNMHLYPDYENITIRKWYKPGSILYRKGDRLHRLIIPKNRYCISLIFTFKRYRDWGIFKNNKWQKHEGQSY